MPDGVTTDLLPEALIVDSLIGNRDGSTVRILIERLAALLVSLIGPVYGTRAALYADLAWPANSVAHVRADGTPAFNGIYKKSGASGAGAWTRIGDLPSGAVEASQLAALEAAMLLRAPLASPALTGAPTAPTAAPGTNTTQIATAAFVAAAFIAERVVAATLTGKTINLTSNTFVATSAQLAAALTDETGTGFAVFSASPALTGTPTAPTAAGGTNTTQIATTAFVSTALAALLASSPAALDTLNELAAALGNDANFAATMTAALAAKAALNSPAFTGTPTAPTAAALTSTTQIASTAFVTAAVAVEKARAEGVEDSLDNRAITTLSAVAGGPAAWTATSAKTVANGGRFVIQFGGPPSGSVTLAVNGGSALPVLDSKGDAIGAGHLQQARLYELRHSTATGWLITNLNDEVLTSRDAYHALDTALKRVLIGRFDGALSAWTGATTGGPEGTNALPASVVAGLDGTTPTLRFTDLTSVGNVLAALRDLIPVVPGRTYRIEAEMRLTGATVLGVDQAQIQHLLLNADYSLNNSGISSPALDLTATWATFAFDWTAPLDTTAAWIRGRAFKRSAYTDATGAIELRRLELSDLTGGGAIPERLGDQGSRLVLAEQRRGRSLAPALAAHALPVPTVQQGRAPLVLASSKWQPLQPRFAVSQARSSAATPKWDLSYLIDGTEVAVWVEATTEFWVGRGNTFFGQGAANRLSVTAPGMVILRAWGRPGETRKVHAQVNAGTPTFTTGAEPVFEVSAVVGGQSNGDRFVKEGGIGGITEALQTAAWMTAGTIDAAIHWIDGATPGTSLLKANDASGTAWWFDDTVSDDAAKWGPAMATCLAAISASVSAGQPAPEVILWPQGEGDVTGLHQGTRTRAELQAGIVAVWGKIRGHCIILGATAPKLFYVGLGAREHATAAIQRKGAALVRWAYVDAIAATAWAYAGIETYDVGRGINEIHYTEAAYWLLGRRAALLWANVRNAATYDLGPVISGVTASADRRVLTVSHSTPTRLLVMPAGEAAGRTQGAIPEALDGAPMLYTVLDSTDTPVQIREARVFGTTVQLHLALPLPSGGRVVYPGGYAQEQRRQDFVRDHLYDEPSGCPGMPLRTYVGAAIA